ncbi:MAG: PKD domain-containing protein [Bacteroidales bacterium]|jgi:PKD repeat protein|nr:PKD domain-containing protein [Bacteroidales bacterium]
MKRIIYMFLVLPLILISCESIPEAQFSADNIKPEVGQEVYFTNESHNAADFEWDFGDGFVSNDRDPVHTYTGTGVFDVVLTAISRKGLEDKATITIEVLIPTLLEIEVLEYYDEYSVADARVRLYLSIIDWEDETNIEAEGYTDTDGFVVFSHLGPWVYYVDVWEANHNNLALKQEPDGVASFIRTDEVMPHKINRFTAWVDYTGTTKGTSKDQKSMVIKKLERRAVDKNLPSVTSDDWQTLYNRSIKVK